MLTIDIDAEGFATLTIDMPGRSMNVIDWNFNSAFDEVMSGLLADTAVKGIVIVSGKPSFVAGADLAIMKDFLAPSMTPASASRKIGEIGQVLRKFEQGGKPVVAAASGTALGGGLELMLAAHYRIAADNPRARFGLPEVTLGLLPGAGGTQRLPRLIGVAKALPILLNGRPLTVVAAKDVGIIDEIVPPENLVAAAKAAIREGRVSASAPWDIKGYRLPGDQPSSTATLDLFSMTNARMLAETQGNYPAPKAILSCVFEGMRLPIDKGLKIERDYFGTLVTDQVAHRMIRTLFFAHQTAAKSGWTPGDPADANVKAGREAYVAEGLHLVRDGAQPDTVENVARSVGMEKGPIEIAREQNRDLPEKTSDATVSIDDIRTRLLTIQALTAARCLEADGERGAGHVDLNAVLGWGFPAWLGGPLSFIDAMGAETFVEQANRLASRYGGRFQPPSSVIAQVGKSAGFYETTRSGA
ncbi:MAG: enoyl-CoA hydratase-related protein [Mesorhizobium sp.]